MAAEEIGCSLAEAAESPAYDIFSNLMSIRV